MRQGSILSRTLPSNVINQDANSASLEAKSVQQRFSDPQYRIGEHNADHVALYYLTPEAALYWLPHFLDYVQADDSGESYHFDSMIYKLSDRKLASTLIGVASEDEIRRVCEFLDWLDGSLSERNLRVTKEERNRARQLWNIY